MLDDLIANDKYWADAKWNHFRLIFGDSLEGVAQRERDQENAHRVLPLCVATLAT